MKIATMTPVRLIPSLSLLLFLSALCGAMDASGAENKGVSQDSPRVIRMASIFDAMPGVNTEDARMAMEMLLRNITDQQGYRFHIQLDFLMDFDQAAERIVNDRYDLVVMPGLDYMRMRNKVDLDPRMVLSRIDAPTEPLVLVTRRDETLNTLAQRDSRILIVDLGRTGEISRFWLDTVMLESGLGSSDQFFTEIRRSQKPSRSVLPVFFGQVAACVVQAGALEVLCELNPQIEHRVRILKRSKDLVTLLLCSTQWADPGDVDKVVAAGIDAIHDPKSRQALTMVQMNRFYPFQPGYLDATAELYERHRRAMERRNR
jgi:hypothetical protein